MSPNLPESKSVRCLYTNSNWFSKKLTMTGSLKLETNVVEATETGTISEAQPPAATGITTETEDPVTTGL